MNDIQVILYSVLLGVMVLAFVIVLIVIAGQDIKLAFKRRIFPRGNDVFIIDTNRVMQHHYLVPEKGVFNVEDDPYIANPNKLLSLDEVTKQRVIESIKKDKERRLKIALKLEAKAKKAEGKILALSNIKEPTDAHYQALDQYKAYIEETKKRIGELRKDKADYQMYFHRRRGVFVYIKGDPVPKNLYDWYTDLDATVLGNIIARSQTKDPKAVKNLEDWLKRNQIYIYVIMGGLAIAIFLIFRNQTMIQQLAKEMGTQLVV